MQRIAVIAKLRPGMSDRAEALIEGGPPFEPAKHGVERHSVFLGSDTVVFVFEGGQVNSLFAALGGANEQAALAEWEPLLEGTPVIARVAYHWDNPERSRQESWGE